MALVVKDRVKVTTTTTGTGTITLGGAASGFQNFSVIGNANQTYYTIVGGSEWEVGIGTYTASGATLSRDTVLDSSNSGNKVNFSAGSKDVFVVYPAGRSVMTDFEQTISNKTVITTTQTALQYATSNLPSIKPTLLLDFANVKALDPRITFTRASEGRYYGTQVAKAEENLQVYSQEFSNALWTKDRITATENTGATTAPDGISTAEKIVEDSTTGVHRFYRGPTITVGLPYTFSVFLKAAERGFAFLQTNNATFDAVSVNLTSGAASSANGSPTNIASTNAGNGWWRVSFTSTPSASSDWYGVVISTDGVWANRSYAGDGTSGIYAWGAQLEQRSAVTAYTPTTTQPITNYIPVLQTAAAGVARFDHNPVTGESLGLLIEGQRTNFAIQSSTHSNTENAGVLGVIPFADGSNANVYQSNLVDGAHRAVKAGVAGGDATVTATFSAFVKIPATSNVIRLLFRARSLAGSGTGIAFSVTAGVPSILVAIGAFGTNPPPTASPSSAFVVPIGNGWYRIGFSATTSSSSATTHNRMDISFSDQTSEVTTGTLLTTAAITGWQMEAGAFPTSYIPTVASQVTRSADAASMTGANFSSWYRADEGSFVVDANIARTIESSQFPTIFRTFNGITGLEALTCYAFLSGGTSNRCSADLSVGGVNQFSLGAASAAFNFTNNIKLSVGYKTNDSAASFAGGSSVADAVCVMPTGINSLFIGSSSGTALFLNGHIRKLAYYPIRCTNAQLQALTS